jgi:hypothetical protein
MRTIFRFLLLLLLPLILVSCTDKQESLQSCGVQIDRQKYSTVAENTNCTNYERGSAYLGQAGVTFANFLQTGATSNLTETLGIKKLNSPIDYTTGNRGYVTSALCLIGANTIVNSDRCSNGSNTTRSSDEVEISMFANIADLIYLSYGVLDNNSNGTISDTEIKAFSDASGIDSDTGLGTELSLYSPYRYELIAGSISYISNDDMTKCVPYSSNYTVDPSTGSDCATLATTDGVTITAVRPILKFDSLIDITNGGSLSDRLDMVSELTSISTALDADFTTLGISSTNSTRKSLTDALSMLDNGAKAKNNATCIAVTAFNIIYLLVDNIADNSTTSSELKDKNIVNVTDITSSVDSTLTTLPDALGALTPTEARLVYAADSPASTWTDSYEKAESSFYTAMKNAKSLGADDVSVKGDGKISLRELLCIGEN